MSVPQTQFLPSLEAQAGLRVPGNESRVQYNVAIGYLRAFVTVLVVAHHAALAYHPFAPAPVASLIAEPRLWPAFPVVEPSGPRAISCGSKCGPSPTCGPVKLPTTLPSESIFMARRKKRSNRLRRPTWHTRSGLPKWELNLPLTRYVRILVFSDCFAAQT